MKKIFKFIYGLFIKKPKKKYSNIGTTFLESQQVRKRRQVKSQPQSPMSAKTGGLISSYFFFL